MADTRNRLTLLQAPTREQEQFFVMNKETRMLISVTIQQDPLHNEFPMFPNTTIKLMLFQSSNEGSTRIRLEKDNPLDPFNWADLVSKFINQFFPPLRRRIFAMRSPDLARFDESFYEALDRFNIYLKGNVPTTDGFFKLHQLEHL
ncbi:hypothetical protein Tco_0883550 [Tanacetum coccineum]